MFRSLRDKTLPDSSSASGVAVAIPNPFDYDQGVSHMEHKYQRLFGTDLRRGLSERLDCDARSIHFLNDADAFLMGELHQGAARGVTRAVGVTLGTGVGSAFAVDKTIVTHGAGVPKGGGVWNLPYGGGIVEDAVSTRAIQRIYEQLTGTCAEVRDIAHLVAQDSHARQTFDIFGRELGRVLRHTCLLFAPDRIIIGGGISQAASLFQQATEAELGPLSARLCVSELFDLAPLVGAGISWMQTHMTTTLPQDTTIAPQLN
jgi:glucokinase